jgi:hypothetical protein
MNNIELSIWGIRRGFEREGIYHTHEIQGVKATQTDRFRNLANTLGNKGFYLIQHTQQKTIISYIETGIREYKPNGPGRQGYVVFSLIIDSNKVFTKSPRAFLNELANFYKTRVGEGDRNNFSTEEINGALASLTLSHNQQYNIQENVRAYSYYSDPSKLDQYLTGNIPFAAFGELALIPTEKDPNTNQFKEVNFINESYGIKPQFIDIFEADQLFRKKQDDDRERELLAQQEAQKLKALANQTTIEIRELIKLGKIEEALTKFSSFDRKDLFDPQMKQQLNEKKAEYDQRNKTKNEANRDQELIEQLYEAYRRKDLATTQIKFDQIKNKDFISSSIKKDLAEFEMKNADEARVKREREKEIKALENRKKQLANRIGFAIAFLILIGGGFASYQFKTPAYFYTSVESSKKGEKDNTIIGKSDTLLKLNPESTDSISVKFLSHQPIRALEVIEFKQSPRPFEDVFIQYTKNGEYRKAKNKAGLKDDKNVIKDEQDIQILNNRFGLNVTVQGGQKPEPARQQQQQQGGQQQQRGQQQRGQQQQQQQQQQQNSSLELPEFPEIYVTEAEKLKNQINDPKVSSEAKKQAVERIKEIKRDFTSNVNKKWKWNDRVQRKLNSFYTVADNYKE